MIYLKCVIGIVDMNDIPHAFAQPSKRKILFWVRLIRALFRRIFFRFWTGLGGFVKGFVCFFLRRGFEAPIKGSQISAPFLGRYDRGFLYRRR